MHQTGSTLQPTIPMVVQIGFAGSRSLFDPAQHPDFDADAIAQQVLGQFSNYLRQLPQTLGLSAHHFLCGVSQVAIGADTVFAQACQALAISQRVLLPQPRDAYLEATSADGSPDFSAAQQRVARELLASPHVIEERTVSSAVERGERFEDANLVILRASDVVVCLVREQAVHKRGGTQTLIDRAISLGKPVLEITVSLVEGRAVLSPLLPLPQWRNGGSFSPPGMPRELANLLIDAPGLRGEHLPAAADFIGRIKNFASERSKHRSGWFKRGAMTIISLHIAATFFAILSGKPEVSQFLSLWLWGELGMLCIGLVAHETLHRSEAVRVWAVNRLVAESMRSLAAVEASGGDLSYPLTLAYDDAFRPLLHTCAVLHRHSGRRSDAATVTSERRAAYLGERIGNLKKGQVRYYGKEADNAARRLRIANVGFLFFSACAIAATTTELLAHFDLLYPALMDGVHHWGVLLAIGLPVAAVGFLSWASASDLEARAQTRLGAESGS